MNQLHLPDQRAEGLALGLARGPSFLQMKFWLDTRLELVAPVPTRRAQGLDLGLARGLSFLQKKNSRSCLLFCFFDPCRPGGCNVWLGLARGFLLGGYQALNQLRRAEGLALGWLEAPNWRRIVIGWAHLWRLLARFELRPYKELGTPSRPHKGSWQALKAGGPGGPAAQAPD